MKKWVVSYSGGTSNSKFEAARREVDIEAGMINWYDDEGDVVFVAKLEMILWIQAERD